MNLLFRRLVVIFIAWLASGFATSLSAATATYAAGKFQIVIDGVVYYGARGFEGGELIADITDDALTAGVQKKHVSNLHASPLRLEFTADNTPGLLAMMNEVLSNQGATHNVIVSRVDYAGTILDNIEFPGATLVGLDLGPYAGASKLPAVFTLIFQPAQVLRTKGNGAKATPPTVPSKPAAGASFRFALDGLPGQHVASVSMFSVRRTVSNEVGAQRDPTAATVKLGISNLILEIASTDLDDWAAWSESFLTQGLNADANEKSGSLTTFAGDMTTAFFSVQFSHVGLVRLSQSARINSDASGQFVVELYVEGASVTTSAPPAGSSTTSTSTSGSTATNPGTATTPVADTGTTAPVGSGTSQPTLGNPTTFTRSTELTSLPVNNPPLVPIATSASTISAITTPTPGSATGSASGDAADQGVRDPREFPRVADVIRKSYDSVDYEASSEETVTYSSKLGIRELIANHEAALKNANWELLRKDETGSTADSSYYFAMKWSKATQAGDLRFSQTKLGGSSVTIFVNTHRQGVLSGLAAKLKDAGEIQPSTKGSPNDVGARDPADFPRISNSTRKSYNSSGSATAPSEDAVYRAKIAITAVEGFYVNQLGQAEWEESVRREGGDPLGGSHVISMNWVLGKRAVKISLREVEPAVTEISVSLSTSS